MSLAPGSRLGRYALQVLLGAGGMGEVYRARDERLERDVAVKVLLPHLASNPRLRERFDREARAVAALNHSHICAVYDFGDAPNPESPTPNPGTVSYLVMERLEGETLDLRIHGRPMPPATIVELALQMAAGLEAAHAKGIVHWPTRTNCSATT